MKIHVANLIKVLLRDEERGQALAEYAFIIALVVIVLVSSLVIFGSAVAEPITSFPDNFSGGGGGS